MKPLPFIALNLAISCLAVLSQRLLLPGGSKHGSTPSRALASPPPPAADHTAAAQALFDSLKGQLNLSTVPAPPFIPPKADYASLAVDALEKEKAALKGAVPDYRAEIQKLLAAKQAHHLGALISLWLDADPAAALSFLESDLDGQVSRLNLRTTLRAYYRDHGQSGFEKLVHSAGKLQKDLAGALAVEDPVRAFAMMPAFSDPAAAASIKQNVFAAWPLDQKDKALEAMASSLGLADYHSAFAAIARRLDIHDLAAWVQSCSQVPGLPEEYRRTILSSPALRSAFANATDLSFRERASGLTGYYAARDQPDPGQPPDFAAQAVHELIRNDMNVYLNKNPQIKSLYGVGAYSAQQLVDDPMSQTGIPPEYRAEVAKQAFQALAPINPSDALTLLKDLPVSEQQSLMMDVTNGFGYLDSSLEQVVAVLNAVPGTLPDELVQKRDFFLKFYFEHALSDSGPTVMKDWIRTADLGSSRPTLEKLLTSH